MPIYLVRCETCGKEQDIFRHVANMDDTPECHGPMKNVICAPMINPDIAPYKAVAVDKQTGKAPYITSRKEHREFLKRNNYQEIGSDIPKKREVRGDFNVRNDLAQATKKVLSQ